MLSIGRTESAGLDFVTTPEVVVFDVNETLSDLAPMADRFVEVGAPASVAKLWFASLLRDGFALTAAGSSAQFRSVAEGALRAVLIDASLTCGMDAAVDGILAEFTQLDVHPDVVDGINALGRHGLRLVTLSNGSTEAADELLSRAGIRHQFEQLLSVEAAGVWKPGEAAYTYAAQSCGVAAGQMLLVAAHPWDIHGAARAGLRTAWINRTNAPYPEYFSPPDHTVTALIELPQRLAA